MQLTNWCQHWRISSRLNENNCKKLKDNRIRRGHVVSGAENDLEDLQRGWEVVQIKQNGN